MRTTKMMQLRLLSILILLYATSLRAQQWEPITEELLASVKDTTSQNDVLNRNVGALAVLPNSGNLILVLNGAHPIYISKDQGETWEPLKKAKTIGRSYGSFSANIDAVTDRVAIFMIVQKKGAPAKGLILNHKGKVLTSIGKPEHDGWTWGMPDWQQRSPTTILGKEHHAWVKMWLSNDGGATWNLLDFESRNPGVISETILVAGNDDGIYRSIDKGKNWEKVAPYKVTGKTPIKYQNHFYWTTTAGLVYTKDQGYSWHILPGKLKDSLWGPFFGKSEQEMMVVCKDGFYISKDAGMSWEKEAEYFAPPNSNRNGAYNVMHPTNSYGWDAKNNIIYAAGLGGQAYRLKL